MNNWALKFAAAGTDIIRIEGVTMMHGTTHTIIPDRIEAGTYLALAAAVDGDITVENVIYEHLESFIAKLDELGVELDISEDKIHVKKVGTLSPIIIRTSPYPGFATDLQQPITPLLLRAHGTSEIIDTIYPQRTNHIPELARMGAHALVEGNTIVLEESPRLDGAEVVASDLRAGACLVTAGLMARGTTVIHNVDYILRGYDHLRRKITSTRRRYHAD